MASCRPENCSAALHRLEKPSYVRHLENLGPRGRKRKHYHLTSKGTDIEAADEWATFAKTVEQDLGIAHVRVVCP